MNKIVLLMVLMVGVTFGQWNLKQNRVDGKYTGVESPGGDTTGSNVYILGTFGAGQFSLPTGMTGNSKVAFKADTLSGASDTVSMDFDNQYAFCYIVLKDTGTSLTDSVKIETYIEGIGWVSDAMSLEELSSANLFDADVVVPGAGKTQIYTLKQFLYPKEVRISWVYGLDKVNRKMPVAFRGTN